MLLEMLPRWDLPACAELHRLIRSVAFSSSNLLTQVGFFDTWIIGEFFRSSFHHSVAHQCCMKPVVTLHHQRRFAFIIRPFWKLKSILTIYSLSSAI